MSARVVATDDASRRLQFIWLGPTTSPWPFEARGVMWLVALAVAAAATPVVYLLIPSAAVSWLVIPAPLVKGALALATAGIVAVLAGRRIGRHISPTTPLRHHLILAVGETSTPRPDAGPVTYELAVPPALFLEDRAEHRQVHVVTVPEFLTAPLQHFPEE